MPVDRTVRQLDFAVIGAQKCATSWLYYCLQDHPQLCVPRKKQEAGYIGGEMFHKNGGEPWFFDRFTPQDSQIMGDVSVEYLFDPKAPEALAPYLPDPRFIVSLRHPVDRMISGYFWLVRRGQLDNVPIEQGIEPILDQKPGFPDPIESALSEVVYRGCYAPQLQRFTDQFGTSALLSVIYENLDIKPIETLEKIYGFLGAEPHFRPPSLNARPKQNVYSPLLLRIENAIQNRLVAKAINHTSQWLARVNKPKDALSTALREKLNQLFAPAIEETRAVLASLPPAQRPSDQQLRTLWAA